MNLCKISIPIQVTTVMLKSTTVCLKRAPMRLSHQRNRGEPRLLQEAAAGCLADGESWTNGNRVPWFFTITPLFGTIASWGFGVNIHHCEQEMNLVGKKLWNKRNNQTRIATKLGLSLCTVTNAHHHCFELVCLLRNNLFSFFFFFNFLLKPNMLLISCMLYVWLLRERKLTNKRCQLC